MKLGPPMCNPCTMFLALCLFYYSNYYYFPPLLEVFPPPLSTETFTGSLSPTSLIHLLAYIWLFLWFAIHFIPIFGPI